MNIPKCPAWWPQWLCLDRLNVWAVLLGLIMGFAISWTIGRAPEPWMEFHSLTASYVSGSSEILMKGSYVVNRECKIGDYRIIWRTEAIATDGQIALYGKPPGRPSMQEGHHHDYVDSIPLLQEILPDGWVVRIIVTCPSEYPETIVSPAAKVMLTR